MSKEKIVTLPFKHVSETEGERTFDGTVIKELPDYQLVVPSRVFFLQMVKFAPGKGFKDYVDCYDAVDVELKNKYGKTRCEMGCHEIVSFSTLGRYDMVVLWDAPDLQTYQRIVAELMTAACGYGSSETNHGAIFNRHV